MIIKRAIPGNYKKLNRAINNLNIKLANLDVEKIPFSKEMLEEHNKYSPEFLKRYQEIDNTLAEQMDATKTCLELQKKSYTCTRHMIINLYMAIEREEIDPSEKALFGLEYEQQNLPYMRNKNELLTWMDNVIDGENKRIAKESMPLTCPDVKQLEELREKYDNALLIQSSAKERYDLALEAVQEIFSQGVFIIKEIWDEIEFRLRHHPVSSRRNKAREWGIEYQSIKGKTGV